MAQKLLILACAIVCWWADPIESTVPVAIPPQPHLNQLQNITTTTTKPIVIPNQQSKTLLVQQLKPRVEVGRPLYFRSYQPIPNNGTNNNNITSTTPGLVPALPVVAPGPVQPVVKPVQPQQDPFQLHGQGLVLPQNISAHNETTTKAPNQTIIIPRFFREPTKLHPVSFLLNQAAIHQGANGTTTKAPNQKPIVPVLFDRPIKDLRAHFLLPDRHLPLHQGNNGTNGTTPRFIHRHFPGHYHHLRDHSFHRNSTNRTHSHHFRHHFDHHHHFRHAHRPIHHIVNQKLPSGDHHQQQRPRVVIPRILHVKPKPILSKTSLSSLQVLEISNERARKHFAEDAAKNPAVKPYVDIIDKLLVLNQKLVRQAVAAGLIKQSKLDASPQIKVLRAQLEGKRLLGGTMDSITKGIGTVGKIAGSISPLIKIFG